MIDRIRAWAKRLKRDITALAIAARDPRTPWYAKALALCVLGYALSPIDLVPDPIPVLGYLDDLILLPIGITLVVKLIPDVVMRESRMAATNERLPASRTAAVAIVLLWLALAILGAWWLRSVID